MKYRTILAAALAAFAVCVTGCSSSGRKHDRKHHDAPRHHDGDAGRHGQPPPPPHYGGHRR